MSTRKPLTRTQLANQRPNRIKNTFEHVGDVVEIGITQRNGTKHIATVDKNFFDVFLSNDEYSYCVRPQNVKNPNQQFYCVISSHGVSEYLHRWILGYALTEEFCTVDHIIPEQTLNCCRSNLRVASSKMQRHNRSNSKQPEVANV